MRKAILFVFALTAVAGQAQQLNKAFKAGEQLSFRFFYDSWFADITAGTGTATVSDEIQEVDGKRVYHIIGQGNSKGAFNLFFKVNDRFESWVDTSTLLPEQFKRRTREGGYVFDDDVYFNHQAKYIRSRRAVKDVPVGTRDVVSAFYYARNWDLENLKVGEIYKVSFLLDDSVYQSGVKFLGRDTIKIAAGRFASLKFKPMVIKGKVFSDPYPMTLWISDDKNRLPLLAESKIVVGKVKMELTGFRGLRHEPESRLGP